MTNGQCVLVKNSAPANEYGGCGSVAATNSNVVFPCFVYKDSTNLNITNCVGSCRKEGNSCTAPGTNTCTMTYRANESGDGYGLASYTGNCACKKIRGGYCGDGMLQDVFGEECDPELSDYANGKLFGSGSGSISQNSSSAKQYLCGTVTSYTENMTDMNKYDSQGNVVYGPYQNIDQGDMSCQNFGDIVVMDCTSWL